MNNKLNNNLSEILDVEPITESGSKEIVPQVPTIQPDNAVEDDAEFARENLKNLIKKGNIAIDELLLVAKESEHPRAYEVASGLIKNLSELNKDLLEIQKRKKDLLPKQAEQNNGLNIDKAVFIGSTTDLIKMLKQGKKEQK